MMIKLKIWILAVESFFISKPDIDHVYAQCIINNISNPKIVVAQSILETGWYNCNNCSLNKNNVFGFQTQKYLQFENWRESIQFYKVWQEKYYRSRDHGCIDYLEWLQWYGYASDPNYIQKLQVISNDLDFDSMETLIEKNTKKYFSIVVNCITYFLKQNIKKI